MRHLLIAIPLLCAAGCVDLALELGPPIVDDSIASEAPAPQASAEVRLENNAFSPAEVTIFVGGTVRWTNFDQAEHTVTEGQPESTSNVFDSGRFGAGRQFSYTFEDLGDVQYFCRTHPQIMRNGMVYVVEKKP